VKDKRVATTEILENVVKKTSSDNKSDKVMVKDLIEALDTGGFGLVIMIFSLPVLIPLPPPFPSLISVPLVIFTFQMMIGFDAPKLPKKFANISVKRTILATMVEKSSPYLRRVDLLLKPRLFFLTDGIAQRFIGFFIFIFASLILLPLPLSNYLPGIGILVTSFGLIARDGVLILLGLGIGILGAIIVAIAVIFGVEAIGIIKNFMMSYL